ncbi:FUSC family protein [Rhodococcus fascians]|nr:FUSC family protein [Rhodococcus fascians]MBY4237927.1 FUSC family protein [Rhodococcus fascians]MBY4253322.1 FUSC family protein [Rhodococcus fascians]MBY4268959.1 FUSC family protein [Rhodococcus fascians]
MRRPWTRLTAQADFGFGKGSYPLAVVLALTLGVVLIGCIETGHPEFGGPLALGFVLTAVPTLDPRFGDGLRTIVVRGSTGLAASAVAVALLQQGVPTGPLIVAVAALGTRTRTAASTPALAVVLTVTAFAHRASVDYWSFVLLYGGGTILVASMFAVFGACRARRRHATNGSAALVEAERLRDYSYTTAMTIGVGIAVSVQALLPVGWEGGHWLITCVILTLQSSPAATRQRLWKRLAGNAVGALIAGVVLAAAPVPVVAVAVVSVLFFVAFALRPVDYFWWAVAAPPLLLLTGTFPHLYPWYEGGVRLVMNVAGAMIVVLVAFAGPTLIGRARER